MTTPESTDQTRKIHGACHCGEIAFEVDLNLSEGTSRCNCRYCTKTGWWGVIVRPDAFRVLKGSEHPNKTHRVHCDQCGVIVYGRGDLPELGGPFVSVNVRTLEDVDLEGAPIAWLDGAHDTWATLRTSRWQSPFGHSPHH